MNEWNIMEFNYKLALVSLESIRNFVRSVISGMLLNVDER